jgi:hypothetical protein
MLETMYASDGIGFGHGTGHSVKSGVGVSKDGQLGHMQRMRSVARRGAAAAHPAQRRSV